MCSDASLQEISISILKGEIHEEDESEAVHTLIGFLEL